VHGDSAPVEYLQQMDSTGPDATVVVCTRNRSLDLLQACEAIYEADFDPQRWEMLIVDNASSDDTHEVAKAFADRHPGRVRLLVEKEVGLSAARNAGIAAATGNIVIFVDDDAFPEPDWLASYVTAFEREQVMCAGGPVAPLFAGELPPWFRGRYLPYLSAWDRGESLQELAYNEYPRGTNIAFRRSVFEKVGTFSHDLGRKDGSLLSCEEIELCLRIERAGYVTLYLPRARVRHLTKVDRLTPEWLMRRFEAQGRSEAIINWRHGGWRGLRAGFRSARRYAREASRGKSISGPLFSRCQGRALRGYMVGMVDAVTTVPRYRPPDTSLDFSDWQPAG